MSISVSAFAATIVVEAGTAASDGTESQDVLKDETYNAYKILNYTASDTDEDNTNDAFSYYLTAAQYAKDNENGLGKLLEGAGFHFTASADGTQYFVDNADEITDAASVANYLYTNKTKIAAVAIATANATASADKTVSFTGLDTGYWFVTSSLGALCSLQSYEDEALIVEKNSIPTVDKEVSDTNTSDDWNDSENGQIGDTVYFKLTVTDGTGTNQDITVTDTMSQGLTYTAGTIKIAGTAVADDADETNYSVDVDGQVITIVLKAAYVATLDTADTVEITFEAKINDKAVYTTADTNKAELDYSNQHNEKTVEVKTYKFEVLKYANGDSSALLAGAVFELQDAGTAVPLIKVSDTEYRVATAAEIAAGTAKDLTQDGVTAAAGDLVSNFITVDSANIVITGVDGDDGTSDGQHSYTLVETKAPDGYNKLDQATTVTIGAANTFVAKVNNQSGAILPSTGGIGTTIFYVVGSILVVAAGVLLITKKRMSREG